MLCPGTCHLVMATIWAACNRGSARQETHARHQAAQVYLVSRRGGGLAGRRVGAASEACANYRLCRADKSSDAKPKYGRIFATAARTRLGGGAKNHNGVSVGGE